MNLQIIAIKQILEFLIFFPIQNFLNFLDSSLKLVIVVGYDDDMEGLIVFEDILLGFIGSSASHCNFTAWSLFDEFLSLSSSAYNFADVVGFGVIDGTFAEVNLFELFERLVIFRRDKA